MFHPRRNGKDKQDVGDNIHDEVQPKFLKREIKHPDGDDPIRTVNDMDGRDFVPVEEGDLVSPPIFFPSNLIQDRV
ncbi:hypothetical protein GCM10008983_14350 [Lentibacillus halophilus]|uniref:Uncharacterized protein n=1 Tax=Lentibacillus halophilus TaxID=295065 RepID=A0ABN0Z8Y9_9BACI